MMNKYKYVGNTSLADSNISVDLGDGRVFGVGQCVRLTEEEYNNLSTRFVLEQCTCERERPLTAKNTVNPVVKQEEKA
jgi:hypothetical protein